MPSKYKKLIDEARIAKKNAYSPYSGFKVGAAVLTGSGSIYTGANVENASYGLSCCAERIAVYKAVASGEKKIRAVAIVSGSNKICPPCGACRQVLLEFGKNIDVVMAGKGGRQAVKKISALLPFSFGKDNI